MALEDKTLQCVECGQNFVLTVSEQEFLASRGYTNQPKRCASCREARRDQRGSRGSTGGRSDGYRSGSGRDMYPAVCASCGKETQVPFQPREGRPVYCSDCYTRVRLTTGTNRR